MKLKPRGFTSKLFVIIFVFYNLNLYSQNCNLIYNSVAYSPNAYPSCVGSSQQFSAYSTTGIQGLIFKWENESHTIISNTSVINYTFSQSGADTIFLVANYVGCPSFIVTLAFYIHSNPEAELNLGPDRIINEGSTTILNATVNGAIGYLWSTGETTSSITVSQSGSFWVKVTNICGIARDTISVFVNQSGIISDTVVNNIGFIYPNPFCDFFDLSYTIDRGSKVNIDLFDVNGKIIFVIENSFKPQGDYKKRIFAKSIGLSSASYYIQIKINNSFYLKKILYIVY